MTGIVTALHVKPRVAGERGLPKGPVDRATFRRTGLDGDYNTYRQTRKGGDPEMAVLLLTRDVLEALRQDGWEIEAGHIGENVTLDGIAYADLDAGMSVTLGEVELEIAKAAEPCANLTTLPYVGRERLKAFMQALLGRRGWYARVVREGTVTVGDRVRVDTPHPTAKSE